MLMPLHRRRTGILVQCRKSATLLLVDGGNVGSLPFYGDLPKVKRFGERFGQEFGEFKCTLSEKHICDAIGPTDFVRIEGSKFLTGLRAGNVSAVHGSLHSYLGSSA